MENPPGAFRKKKPLCINRAAFGEVLRGGGKEHLSRGSPGRAREHKTYIDGGAEPVGEPVAGWPCPSAVLVMSRISTRRFAARPSRVLLSSAGLSLPRPIK